MPNCQTIFTQKHLNNVSTPPQQSTMPCQSSTYEQHQQDTTFSLLQLRRSAWWSMDELNERTIRLSIIDERLRLPPTSSPPPETSSIKASTFNIQQEYRRARIVSILHEALDIIGNIDLEMNAVSSPEDTSTDHD